MNKGKLHSLFKLLSLMNVVLLIVVVPAMTVGTIMGLHSSTRLIATIIILTLTQITFGSACLISERLSNRNK